MYRVSPVLHTKAIPGKTSAPSPPDRILERDIPVLIVRAGELATRKRTGPQQQMQCTGGSASKMADLFPREMRCLNMGVDDQGRVNWDCRASDLDKRVRVENAEVVFEGYSGPGDEYVRVGSGVVRYELARIAGAGDETIFYETTGWEWSPKYTWIAFGVVATAVLLWLTTRPAHTANVVIEAESTGDRVVHYHPPAQTTVIYETTPPPQQTVIINPPKRESPPRPPLRDEFHWWVPDHTPQPSYRDTSSSGTRDQVFYARSGRSE